MFQIFLIVVPVFLVLGAGYLAVKFNYVKPDIADYLNTFSVKLAVPFLLFLAMYKLDFSQAFQWQMLASFYAGAFFSFFLGIFLARTVWRRKPGEAVAVGFCALFSNTVLLGIPIVERAYGSDALPPVFAIISCHSPSLYTLGIVSMELSRRDGRPLSETALAVFKSIFSNSLMIGVLSGVFCNIAGIKLPEPILAAMSMLAAAAIPSALVGIGASLTRYSLKSEVSESLAVTLLSLVIHPGIAFLLSYHVFGLPGEFVRAAVVIAAMPPGVNAYIFATMYGRAVSLSASAILIATPISIATVSAWLSLLRFLGI